MTEDLDKTMPPQRPAGNDFDVDKTIPPQRPGVNMPDMDKTMPGHHDRKTDGRFAVGDLIMGRYKVLAELGQGGMGVVYKCFDETAGIEVALKALPPELSHNTLEMDDIKDNFQLVHALFHPHIAASNNLERNPENGNYYLIMECCEGEDLRRWIKRKRRDNPLTLDDVLPVIKQVAEALDYAHAQKIMHRDIKPGNIMIDSVGNVKVLDFGLAAQIHTSMTRVSMAYHGTSGTGPYMAPEQWRGRAQGAAADQYALAVMAYEMLAGRLPFESTDPAVLKQAVLDETPDEIPDLPADAQAALKRAMSKEAADRFNSCADFVSAMTGAKVGKIKIEMFIGRSTMSKWIAAVIVLALIVAGLLFFTDANEKAAIKAQKEAEEREKQEQIELDRTYSSLRFGLEEKTKTIEDNYYHKLEPPFEKKWAELQKQMKAAENTTLLQTKVNALQKAMAAADWILNSVEPRRQARKLLEDKIPETRSAAVGNKADQVAPNTFADAATKAAEGKKAYDQGDFARAIDLLNASVQGYENAKNEAGRKALKLCEDGTTVIGVSDKYITGVEIPDGVTNIGDGAFDGCSKLTSITIPDSVTSIGEKAFQRCESLTSITIPDSVTSIGNGAFQRCKSLTSVTIPDSVTSIGEKTFYECDSLKSITIPDSVTSIGEGAFCGCRSLTSITIPSSVTSIGEEAFRNCDNLTSITIPSSVTSIGDQAFYGCDKLTSITIPDSVTSIGEEAFYGCSKLTSITIPDSVTSIGEKAFEWCTSLSVTIPDSVTSIGNQAFFLVPKVQVSPENQNFSVDSQGLLIDKKQKRLLYAPPSVTNVAIPDGVTSIGDSAFSWCKSLTSVTIPNSVKSIEDRAFLRCENLTSVTIPNSVTSIGYSAFRGCTSLTSITIPDSVTSIGYSAFGACSSLTSITIGNSVTSIEGWAFHECKSLTSITIPDSVKSIGKAAFYECKFLTSITIPSRFTDADVKLWFMNDRWENTMPSSCKIIRR